MTILLQLSFLLSPENQNHPNMFSIMKCQVLHSSAVDLHIRAWRAIKHENGGLVCTTQINEIPTSVALCWCVSCAICNQITLLICVIHIPLHALCEFVTLKQVGINLCLTLKLDLKSIKPNSHSSGPVWRKQIWMTHMCTSYIECSFVGLTTCVHTYDGAQWTLQNMAT